MYWKVVMKEDTTSSHCNKSGSYNYIILYIYISYRILYRWWNWVGHRWQCLWQWLLCTVSPSKTTLRCHQTWPWKCSIYVGIKPPCLSIFDGWFSMSLCHEVLPTALSCCLIGYMESIARRLSWGWIWAFWMQSETATVVLWYPLVMTKPS